jgi:hypothetical protein
MLTIASAGLTIPIERLEQKNYPYPFKDSVKYQQAHSELNNLLAEKLCGSILLKNYPQSWCFGRLATTVGEPDTWTELQYPQPMPNNQTVKSVLKHLRNAFAHGSIHTKDDPISELTFIASVRRYSPDFNYLMVSPDDFRIFLQKWFKFLGTLKF